MDTSHTPVDGGAVLLISTLERVTVLGYGEPRIMGGPHGQLQRPVTVQLADGRKLAVREIELVKAGDIDLEHYAMVWRRARNLAEAGRPNLPTIDLEPVYASAARKGYAEGRSARLQARG
jgi:hypothetical protein